MIRWELGRSYWWECQKWEAQRSDLREEEIIKNRKFKKKKKNLAQILLVDETEFSSKMARIGWNSPNASVWPGIWADTELRIAMYWFMCLYGMLTIIGRLHVHDLSGGEFWFFIEDMVETWQLPLTPKKDFSVLFFLSFYCSLS